MSEIDAAIEVMNRAIKDIAELRRLLAAAMAERDSARALLLEIHNHPGKSFAARIVAELHGLPPPS